ncbi:MAG: hypothetical protein AB1324_03105 [Candidatus Micrarchaeota archaeon]
MEDDITRSFRYAAQFYLKRLALIVIFSIPFLASVLILWAVAAPTYGALGGIFLRINSLPELSLIDIAIIAAGYLIAMFVIADTIVNINIIVRSKRTLTSIRHEVLKAMGSYAMRIFYIYTLALLVMLVAQLILYDNPLQPWIYPLVSLALYSLLFFVPPAVVIDNSDTPTAIRRSAAMCLKNPHMILIWAAGALLALSLVKALSDIVFATPFSGYFVLLVNSLIVLPFLTVLQTQMYMEKYPLAR